jgi:hypothetical protein
MRNIFLLLQLLIIFGASGNLKGQAFTQNLRGRITDNESQAPLVGVVVGIYNDSVIVKGTFTDEEGYYKVEHIPLGRISLKAEYLGYYPARVSNIQLNSAKETILNVGMEASAEVMQEVTVTSSDKAGAVNDMALVSTRTFSVNETERYAGSRGDPARMASNFAGVQGANDARNDIVIRGNSPMGVLYRLNDVDIPNPNHFAVAGTMGGPVSIINNKMLTASDFMTGAFPAEYGNAIAGVFDLKMKNGNNEKHEFTGQFGFLGTEATAEGPLSRKSRASYIVNYRYSTLKLFEALKFNIGTSAVPNYQDASFKVNLPTKKSGTFSFFGIGGSSKIDIVLSKQSKEEEEIYGLKDRDQYFRTAMGIVGFSHLYTLDANTLSRFTVSVSSQQSRSYHVRFFRDTNYRLIDSLTKEQLRYNFRQTKVSFIYSFTKKVGSRNVLKTGIYLDNYFFNFIDSNYSDRAGKYLHRMNYSTSTYMIQPYVQLKHQLSEKLFFNAGLHYQYFVLNGSQSLEPRFAVKWKFREKQSLGLGYGLHSQLQPTHIYFQNAMAPEGETIQPNRHLGFTRSHHLVLSYDYLLSSNLRIKSEIYYQHLFNVPVTLTPSAFSIVNQGGTFVRLFPPPLTNKGTANNYGFEFTLERFFSNNYYFMFTSSIYNSRYKGSDGVNRNTDFNGNFALNLLGGTEFSLGKSKRSILTLGSKITWAGGRRYGLVDLDASKEIQEVVFKDEQRNEFQFRNYFRADLKIGYKRNNKNVMHEIGLDLVNIFGTRNLLGLTYAPDPLRPEANPMQTEYQLGFLPRFYYRIDF